MSDRSTKDDPTIEEYMARVNVFEEALARNWSIEDAHDLAIDVEQKVHS